MSIKFEDYANKYKNIKLERRNGILQITLHTDGKDLIWGAEPHDELSFLFGEIGRDPENRVIILTGTGDTFAANPAPNRGGKKLASADWEHGFAAGKHLLMNHLAIEAPMIAAVNGPALRHAELAVLCDIVLASDTACFQDSGHFINGVVPGDGVHVVWPLVLGPNRGRYFLFTGQKISAQEALTLGVVSEVLPRERLLARAWELAEQIAAQPRLTTRYTRVLVTQTLKRMMQDNLGYGLALEGLAFGDHFPDYGPSFDVLARGGR